MGADVTFEVMFECLVCRPVEGMRFRAIVKNITKAGVRAETNTEPSPVVVFIARDHHYKSKGFSSLKEGDEINVRVIGIRYELNDRYISIIGEHVPTKTGARRIPRKPKISISAKSFGKKST
jgi:DNA-directed RNA polymerase subunit E'/Rpb7